MAHNLGKVAKVVSKNGATLLSRLAPTGFRGVLPGQLTRVASLIATYGEKYPYVEPWPYEQRRLNVLTEWIDNSTRRMNDNSKIIIVEGNIGVGKNEFASRLAKNFDLKYIPALEEDECFRVDGSPGFDYRDLNYALPKSAQYYDLKAFYSEKNPQAGTVGRLQILFYRNRYDVYQKALLHLFSTGQGCVITRSVFGEAAFVDACRKMSYITPEFHKYYHMMRANSICELLNPHLTIYLDAPVSVLRERIKKRADPKEVNSSILSDKYLEAIEESYRQQVLPKLRQTGEVVEIDWAEVADEQDMDVIVEELATIKLHSEDNEEVKFHDWILKEDDICTYRKLYGGNTLHRHLMFFEPPFNCPEVLITGDDYLAHEQHVNYHPALSYASGWSPELCRVNPHLRLW